MRERAPVWTVHVGHPTNRSHAFLPILFTAKRGARTLACRLGTRANTRSHECERCTQECVRHIGSGPERTLPRQCYSEPQLAMATPSATPNSTLNSLVRTLGVGDLTWLYLVAVVNLNTIPVIAAEGFHVMWLWAAVTLFFFLPQGIAVIELAEQMPGEGGLYLWSKEAFGDFHGFMCGWCYWVTNMF